MTDAERKLWWHLRANTTVLGKFRRQEPVDHYIADFLSYEHRLIIEVDGSQHNIEVDAARDAYLTSQGFHILRFNNLQVLMEIDGVLATINLFIQKTNPSPGAHAPPSPARGEG